MRDLKGIAWFRDLSHRAPPLETFVRDDAGYQRQSYQDGGDRLVARSEFVPDFCTVYLSPMTPALVFFFFFGVGWGGGGGGGRWGLGGCSCGDRESTWSLGKRGVVEEMVFIPYSDRG